MPSRPDVVVVVVVVVMVAVREKGLPKCKSSLVRPSAIQRFLTDEELKKGLK
jgi:hypothetical protein